MTKKKKERNQEPKFRHEYKISISLSDYYVLKSRLRAVMKPDPYAGPDGIYRVHSLYFDNIYDKALMEKVNGINNRDKFRIRYYNSDTDFIRLEKKSKRRGLCHKESERITRGECERLLAGDIGRMKDDERALIRELYTGMKTELLVPRTVITYDRIPFVFDAGNVRVTLDKNIRTSMYNTSGFMKTCEYNVPVIEDNIILEIKYDEFLPDIIRSAAGLRGKNIASYSKYERGRCWG